MVECDHNSGDGSTVYTGFGSSLTFLSSKTFWQEGGGDGGRCFRRTSAVLFRRQWWGSGIAPRAHLAVKVLARQARLRSLGNPYHRRELGFRVPRRPVPRLGQVPAKFPGLRPSSSLATRGSQVSIGWGRQGTSRNCGTPAGRQRRHARRVHELP